MPASTTRSAESHAPRAVVDGRLQPDEHDVHEATYGYSFNEIDNLFVTRCQTASTRGSATCRSCTRRPGPLIPSYHAAGVVYGRGVAVLVDGRVMYPPVFEWGHRIANAAANLSADCQHHPSHARL